MQRSFNQSCSWAICFLILCAPILFAQSKPTPVQRWEYQTIGCDKNELDKLGDTGWELVTVTTNNAGYCAGYLLKRPKAADAPRYVEPAKRPAPPPHTPACNLSLAQAPTIRGLRLGMTVDELIELFPGANPNELRGNVEQAKGAPNFGYLSFNFSGIQHKDRLEGQRFNINLFDSKVTSFRINYSFYNHPQEGQVFNSEQFRERLIETFSLPAKEYWQEADSNINLQCRGFGLNSHLGSNLSIYVFDTSKEPEEKTKQRRNEALAKKRAEFKP